MPMDRGTPDLVRHCVAAVAKQHGGDTDKAFAICVAQLQKNGYLKPGTMELTAAGKAKEKEHEGEPDAAKKLASYEKLLKANRKTEESVETLAEDWGSSDQRAMNHSIHRALKNPKYAPPLSAVLDAAITFAEFYWHEWPEYQADPQGMEMEAARRYYRAMFPDFFKGMQKLLATEAADPRKVMMDFIWKKTHKDFKGTTGGKNILVLDPKTGGSKLQYLDALEPEELKKIAQRLGFKESVDNLSEMAGLKSRKLLWQFLKDLQQKPDAPKMKNLPADAKGFADEVYGKKAMIYFSWASPEDRKAGERALKDAGFKVNADYHPGSAISEIQVSYFKGWHWDESRDDESPDYVFEALLDRSRKSGFEALPTTISRKHEVVSQSESPIDAMRRLAGLGARFSDRSLTEKAKDDVWQPGLTPHKQGQAIPDGYLFADPKNKKYPYPKNSSFKSLAPHAARADTLDFIDAVAEPFAKELSKRMGEEFTVDKKYPGSVHLRREKDRATWMFDGRPSTMVDGRAYLYLTRLEGWDNRKEYKFTLPPGDAEKMFDPKTAPAFLAKLVADKFKKK